MISYEEKEADFGPPLILSLVDKIKNVCKDVFLFVNINKMFPC